LEVVPERTHRFLGLGTVIRNRLLPRSAHPIFTPQSPDDPMLPSLFISHGAPDLVLTDNAAREFLSGLMDMLPERPKAILVASAHWDTPTPAISAPATNDTIYDFGGFQAELYRMTYPAPGAPALASLAAELLSAAGMAAHIDPSRGLDHGAWVPLMIALPGADIPVAQLSLQADAGPAHHLALGQALAPLRTEGVLVIGSGSLTHNLAEYFPLRRSGSTAEPDWVRSFADWADDRLARRADDDLLDYRRLAPHAARNHPTEEHLLPLFVAMGAGGRNARRLHASVDHGVLRMDAFAFGET
jgi:4,5-DOPA dioxygenase extradiol